MKNIFKNLFRFATPDSFRHPHGCRNKCGMAIIFISLLMLSVQAQAAADKYIYDPSHTQILFSANHLGFSNSHGQFTRFEGGFTFDQENPESSQAEMVIYTDSIDLESEKWNAHMKNADFFNVEKFPTMTFKSTGVKKTGDKTADVTGDFTLLGVTKPVTLQVTFNKADTFPMNKNHVAGFSARGTLKRSDFGMVYGLPAVADDINLIIEVEGIRQDFDKINKG